MLGRIARSATRLGPLDAVFAGLDYAEGKTQGEDDIRALAGATGSTLGGWGGAVAGGTAGTAILPGVGTVAGAILGGMAGSTVGGYAADRVDETLRPNSNTINKYKGDNNMDAYKAWLMAGSPVTAANAGISWVSNQVGNQFKRGIDTVTGQATNFDGDPENAQRMSRANQTLQDPLLRDGDNRERQLMEYEKQYRTELADRQQQQYTQLRDDARENQKMSDYYSSRKDRAATRATYARDLLQAYQRNIPAEIQQVVNARFY